MAFFQHIGGEELTSSNYYSVYLGNANIECKLPHFESSHVEMIKSQLIDIPNFSLESRREIVQKLAWYEPSEDILNGLCIATNMPKSLVLEKINSGKKIALNISSLDPKDSNKTAFTGISPNDPREYFYFLSHFIMTGTRCTIKSSSREPYLGLDLVRYLYKEGLPSGMVNLIFADSTHSEQSKNVKESLLGSDVPIVMGDANLVESQISFYAEHSRSLILDADLAIKHLEHSILWPNSCLAEHNLIVVGKENYEKIISFLVSTYEKFKLGNLLDESTTLGEIDSASVEKLTDSLQVAELFDTVKILYPQKSKGELINLEDVKRGIVLEHFSEDKSCGVNPLFASPLPLYITCLRYCESFDNAVSELKKGQNAIKEKTGHQKCMALSIYGEINLNQKTELQSLAFDLHLNKSPMLVDGFVHQSILLHEVLTK
jgi:hypothetical protein